MTTLLNAPPSASRILTAFILLILILARFPLVHKATLIFAAPVEVLEALEAHVAAADAEDANATALMDPTRAVLVAQDQQPQMVKALKVMDGKDRHMLPMAHEASVVMEEEDRVEVQDTMDLEDPLLLHRSAAQVVSI